MVARSNKGRQVIPMIKIVSELARATSYSKRKSSLLKKANALCALIGAKMALIINTPGGSTKPFSFGHPSVGEIVHEFLEENPQHEREKVRVFLSKERSENRGHCAMHDRVSNELRRAEGLREEAARADRENKEERRYKRPVEEMDVGMMESFYSDLGKLSGILGDISRENKRREAQEKYAREIEAQERLKREMEARVRQFQMLQALPRAFEDGSSSSRNNDVMPLGAAPLGFFDQQFDHDLGF